MSDIEGKVTRVGASERGQRTSFNGANGMSDIEGKVTRVGASERGQRTSFKTPRYRGKAKVDLQNQFIGAVCNVKRWPRLLALQSSRTERSQNPVRQINATLT
jgi:hypothetical protein